MKILYLCHRIPYPPDKGEKIRSYHQVRHLARRHEVHLFSLADRPDDLAYRRELEAFCRTVELEYLNPRLGRLKALLALCSSGPMTMRYFHSARLRRKVREALTRDAFDVAVAYSSGMIPYLLDAGVPLAIDFVDLDSQKWLQYASSTPPPLKWIYGLEGRRLFAYEKMASARAEASIVVTPQEGRVLAEQGAPRRLEAVPLGVDIEHYRRETPEAEELAGRAVPRIIFVGFMAYRPNYEAVLRIARGILPSIRARVPDVQLLVVGAGPPRAVRDLHDGCAVIVTGRVADTRPYLKAADVALIPLSLGRGIQTKVLEAMAMQRPVVLSRQAAIGVSAKSGRDYIVCETDAALADAVVGLLENREKARAIGAAGHRFVKEHFNWEDKLNRYEKILEEISTTPRG
jgi:sugar transferase (PEP-CTERM/EpsH1 system associated)